MEEWDLQRLDATIQTAALCAYADGHLADAERERMCECIATFASSESEAKKMIDLARNLPEWCGQTPKGWRAEQILQIKAALPDRNEREHAFQLAVDVAHVHEGIGVREIGFLLTLMEELDIAGDKAREMIRGVSGWKAK